MEKSQSKEIDQLATALSIVQGKLKPAGFNCKNPYYNSKYADMVSIWESCRQLLSENGLAVIQTMDFSENSIIIITTLTHKSGQWIKGKLAIRPVRQKKDAGFEPSLDPQAIGQAITYGRRYSLSAIIGQVSDEDTDAESMMNRKGSEEKKTPGPKGEERKSQASKSSFDILKDIGELKKLVDESEYYKALGKFVVSGKPAEHSNKLGPKQRQNFVDNLTIIKDRNERFIKLCLDYSDKVSSESFQNILKIHDVADGKLKDENGLPIVLDLDRQKSILDHLKREAEAK